MFDKVLGMPYCVKYARMQVFFPYKEGIYREEKTRVLAYIVQCLCIWAFKVKKLNSLLSVWNSYQDLLVICSQYKKNYHMLNDQWSSFWYTTIEEIKSEQHLIILIISCC